MILVFLAIFYRLTRLSNSVERPKLWLKSDRNIEHFALHVLLLPAK